MPLSSAYRYEGAEVNMTLAKSEAKILHGKIVEKAYSHEEIIRILTTRSKAQVLATLNHYNNEFGNPINKVVLKHPIVMQFCLFNQYLSIYPVFNQHTEHNIYFA